jgi:hypothetical protein
MKELLYFKIKSCPYCIEADKWLAELIAENPDFANIKIKQIDEQIEVDLANSYDYYYVPTFFKGTTKLHEGAGTKDALRRVLEAM